MSLKGEAFSPKADLTENKVSDPEFSLNEPEIGTELTLVISKNVNLTT
jgi:hypothetical protein